MLKSTYEPDHWKPKAEKIIDRLKGNNRNAFLKPVRLLCGIYLEEGFYDKILKALQDNPGDLGLIETFGSYLKEIYPVEILDLWVDGIRQYADRNVGRRYYHEIVQLLRKLRKLKDGKAAEKMLVSEFRTTYTRRRAMMEILNNAYK